MSGFVYFIKPVDQDGPIKVGHSIHPPHRLSSLQTWSPVLLEIAASFEGQIETERAIHHRFAHCQVRGEWFDADPDLIALIDGIRAGRKIDELIDLTAKSGKLFRRPNTPSPEAKAVASFKRRAESARKYACRAAGHLVHFPDDVGKILRSAGGYRQEFRKLSADEVAVLEAYIASCRSKRGVAA
ncbi:hypothetical protein EVC28_053 [Rhizobium phage RHph_I1_23]|nr:hypothetical protein EVC28_053 [Rhizobium phage RHph_I1_23]